MITTTTTTTITNNNNQYDIIKLTYQFNYDKIIIDKLIDSKCESRGIENIIKRCNKFLITNFNTDIKKQLNNLDFVIKFSMGDLFNFEKPKVDNILNWISPREGYIDYQTLVPGLCINLSRNCWVDSSIYFLIDNIIRANIPQTWSWKQQEIVLLDNTIKGPIDYIVYDSLDVPAGCIYIKKHFNSNDSNSLLSKLNDKQADIAIRIQLQAILKMRSKHNQFTADSIHKTQSCLAIPTVWGLVTNGKTWSFYSLDSLNKFYLLQEHHLESTTTCPQDFKSILYTFTKLFKDHQLELCIWNLLNN